MRSPAFVTEAHRQSLAVAKSPHAKKDQDLISAVSGARVGRLADEDMLRLNRAALVFLGIAAPTNSEQLESA